MSGQQVKFASENKQGDAWGCVFRKPTSQQGLIVLHEWWGSNDQTKTLGTELANDGNFTVIVPDLYRGKLTTDTETAGHYMKNLDWKGAVEDIAACVKYLKDIGCKKVGVTGFCMGGALSFACAALIPDDISAAAPFYGIPSQDVADLTKMQVPVESHFAEDDHVVGFSTKNDYEALRVKLDAAGVPFVLHEYKAPHAFCNSSNKEAYREDLAKLALGRMIDFMHKNLS